MCLEGQASLSYNRRKLQKINSRNIGILLYNITHVHILTEFSLQTASVLRCTESRERSDSAVDGGMSSRCDLRSPHCSWLLINFIHPRRVVTFQPHQGFSCLDHSVIEKTCGHSATFSPFTTGSGSVPELFLI